MWQMTYTKKPQLISHIVPDTTLWITNACFLLDCYVFLLLSCTQFTALHGGLGSSERSVPLMARFGHPESVEVFYPSWASVFVSKLLMQWEKNPKENIKALPIMRVVARRWLITQSWPPSSWVLHELFWRVMAISSQDDCAWSTTRKLQHKASSYFVFSTNVLGPQFLKHLMWQSGVCKKGGLVQSTTS